MTYVIAIAQRKGGAGKTTLTCQLAAALSEDGCSVAGVDADPQGSFQTWTRRRRAGNHPKHDIECTAASGFGIGTAIRRTRGVADFVLIDTAPSVDSNIRNAVRAADLVLTPLQLSPLDLDATMPTARLVGELGRPVMFVVNRAPARARIADAIRAEIKRNRLPLAEAELGNRAAFSESLADGLGVVETAAPSKAAAEIRALKDEICIRLGRRQGRRAS